MFWEPRNLDFKIFCDSSNAYFSCSELDQKIESFPKLKQRQLIVAFTARNIHFLSFYLWALRNNHVLILSDSNIDTSFQNELIQKYKPNLIWQNSVLESIHETPLKLHKSLALTLSTSGSTGDSKQIRLSYNNIQENASSIAQYLDIDSTETAITNLPLHYSYGLSILNSHLEIGANIILSEKSIVDRNFWKLFKEKSCTSLAGVPYIYETLKKLRFERMELPALRYLTQAGGKLDDEYIEYISDYSQNKNIRFFVMYGQTEATARISYLPPLSLEKNIGSIGRAIPGGELFLKNTDVFEKVNNFSVGELCYKGPNVMMGYANSKLDLSMGEEQNSELETGDLGYCDDQGLFFIVGRIKRFIKLFGIKVGLDDLEAKLKISSKANILITGNDDHIMVALDKKDENKKDIIKEILIKSFGFYHKAIEIQLFDEFPRLSSNKYNYENIKQCFQSRNF
jgi:long-chain acyl-CoA synthetase